MRGFLSDLVVVAKGMWRVAPLNVVMMVVLAAVLTYMEPLVTVLVVGALILAFGLHARFSEKGREAVRRDRERDTDRG